MRNSLANNLSIIALCGATCTASVAIAAQTDGDVLAPISERFSSAESTEAPSFQRHIVNLFGRLGCNGRACHGSFQGRGGFQLSLFGYDFTKDHAALFDKESPRVDLLDPEESLLIVKPSDELLHEGGQRFKKGSWQYHALLRWVQSGAKVAAHPEALQRLEIIPAEIWFQKQGEQIQLKAVAVWEDGSKEDVTPLCRFKSNNTQVATIDEDGLVIAKESGDTHVVVSYDKGVVAVPVIRPVSDLARGNYPAVPTPTKVDELVVQKLRKLGIVPSDVCSDAAFLRRVSLDMTGSLPTPAEVEGFLADTDPGKRAKKIDQLLETPAYAAWWTTKLCDFTGNNDQRLNNASPMRGRPSQEWYDWIHKRVSENMPYDQLVEGIACAASLKPGQTYADFCSVMSDVYRPDSDTSFADLDSMTYYWARQDFRDIEARAIGFAYSFMGIRIECAQCHKHPFDQWSKNDFHQFKNFFARVVSGRNTPPPEYRNEYNRLVADLGLKGKRGNELRQLLPRLLKEGKTVPFPATYNASRIQRTRSPMGDYPEFDNAKLLGGAEVDVTALDEPRQVLMDWLRSPDNRFFAPALVNRIWASYFNVGIVDPPDDLSLANPPSNKPLLDYLARGFIESGFDMKWIHRTIANSRTYQASWQPNETNAGDQRNFSHAVVRRLPAEVVYDAIQQASHSDEQIAAMHQDAKGRAIAIAGASVRSNQGGAASYALTVFGRSTRDSNCDCDRSSEPTLLQTVYLQNDRDILQLIDIRRGGWLNQVAAQLNPKKTNANQFDPRRVAGYRKQYYQAIRQLKLLKNRNADQQQILRAQRRVDGMKKRIAEYDQQQRHEKVDVDEAVVRQLVRQAYLRTLSRPPKDDELIRSLTYVREADDTVDGIRDVLWALLNTKEFIVNH
jgi:hypothetical protein